MQLQDTSSRRLPSMIPALTSRSHEWRRREEDRAQSSRSRLRAASMTRVPIRSRLRSAHTEDGQRQREWGLVVQALNDNSLAVVRAMRRFRNEAEQEQVERVLTSYEAGS